MAIHVYFMPAEDGQVAVLLEAAKKPIGTFDAQALLAACPIDWDVLKVHPDEVTEAERAALQAYGVELWKVLGKDKFTRMVAKQRQQVTFGFDQALVDNHALFQIPWEAVYSDMRYGKYRPSFVLRTHSLLREGAVTEEHLIQKYIYQTLQLITYVHTAEELNIVSEIYLSTLPHLAPEKQVPILERMLKFDMLPTGINAKRTYLREMWDALAPNLPERLKLTLMSKVAEFHREDIELQQQTLKLAEQLNDVPVQIKQLYELGMYHHYEVMDEAAAKDLYGRAVSLAEQTDDLELQAQMLASYAPLQNDPQAAKRAFMQATDLAEDSGNAKLHVEITLAFVDYLLLDGDALDPLDRPSFDAAAQILAAILPVAEALEDRLLYHDVLHQLAEIFVEISKHDRARPYAEQLLQDVAHSEQHMMTELLVLNLLQQIYTELGEAALAEEMLSRLSEHNLAIQGFLPQQLRR